jgi:hypothetical protein
LTDFEFKDLVNNGIDVVFNWEYAATAMLNGLSQGRVDATNALVYIQQLPGIPAGYKPVVYFSCDFDAAPGDQTAINAYLQGAAQVLGGPQYVGIYGGYWPLSRALDAGVCKWAWQTEAWSGTNVDSRINIMQRNSLGYETLNGVQADIDEQHTDDIGAFVSTPAPPPPAPAVYAAGPKPADQAAQLSQIYDQLMIVWPQLGNLTLVDAVAKLLKGQA